MRLIVLTLLSLLSLGMAAQEKLPGDFGFRHLQTIYKGDTIDILVKGKTNEELKPKPLLLFCQGSLPQPFIKYDEKGMFGVFGGAIHL